MHFVPPKSLNGSFTSIPQLDAYWIARTEVTYGLWSTVHSWATSNGYTFANSGTQGDNGSRTDQHPVTTINWRDAMIWTNALTEWYNAQTGAGLEPVYYTDSNYTTPIRSVDDTTTISWDSGSTYEGTQDEPFLKSDANGFRLPTKKEWELAARYIEDADSDGGLDSSGEYYPRNYASGADALYDAGSASSDLDGDGDTDVSADVAWYNANSGNRTHEVATRDSNALGLYDMSGNVYEWTFDWGDGADEGSGRELRGGSWGGDPNDLKVALVLPWEPYKENPQIGFRPVRNAQ
jgi:formylglycine-generating enzyme required for sulfatase activity